jgi:hypothetical protein
MERWTQRGIGISPTEEDEEGDNLKSMMTYCGSDSFGR